MIHKVEGICAELQALLPEYDKVLEERHIDAVVARTVNRVGRATKQCNRPLLHRSPKILT